MKTVKVESLLSWEESSAKYSNLLDKCLSQERRAAVKELLDSNELELSQIGVTNVSRDFGVFQYFNWNEIFRATLECTDDDWVLSELPGIIAAIKKITARLERRLKKASV